MKKLKKEDKKEIFSVTLDRGVVRQAKKIMDARGSKLSPVINNLLKKWIEKQKNQEKKYGRHIRVS